MTNLDDEVPVPRHEVRGGLLGYCVEDETSNASEKLFETIEDAKAASERVAGHQLVWDERASSDFNYPRHRGSHPKLHERERLLMQPSCNLETMESLGLTQEKLAAELGYYASFRHYWIEPRFSVLLKPVPGASFIDVTESGGYYIHPYGGRLWAVNKEGHNRTGGFITLSDSRIGALTEAWKLRHADLRCEARNKHWIIKRGIYAERRAGFKRLLLALFRRSRDK